MLIDYLEFVVFFLFVNDVCVNFFEFFYKNIVVDIEVFFLVFGGWCNMCFRDIEYFVVGMFFYFIERNGRFIYKDILKFFICWFVVYI